MKGDRSTRPNHIFFPQDGKLETVRHGKPHAKRQEQAFLLYFWLRVDDRCQAPNCLTQTSE
jgi:hypothetical protein